MKSRIRQIVKFQNRNRTICYWIQPKLELNRQKSGFRTLNRACEMPRWLDEDSVKGAWAWLGLKIRLLSSLQSRALTVEKNYCSQKNRFFSRFLSLAADLKRKKSSRFIHLQHQKHFLCRLNWLSIELWIPSLILELRFYTSGDPGSIQTEISDLVLCNTYLGHWAFLLSS